MTKMSSERKFKMKLREFFKFQKSMSYVRLVSNNGTKDDYFKMKKIYDEAIYAGQKAFENTFDKNIMNVVNIMVNDRDKIFGSKPK